VLGLSTSRHHLLGAILALEAIDMKHFLLVRDTLSGIHSQIARVALGASTTKLAWGTRAALGPWPNLLSRSRLFGSEATSLEAFGAVQLLLEDRSAAGRHFLGANGTFEAFRVGGFFSRTQ